MSIPRLDMMSEEVLRNIVYYLVQPPFHDIREEEDEREPNLLPLFNLGQTCKRLQHVLIQPESNEAYWRQVMLDSGSGRPFQQPAIRLYSGDEVFSVPNSAKWLWKTFACRQAHLEREDEHNGVYYGRGLPASVTPGPVPPYYHWVPEVLRSPLPAFPNPEIYRILSLEESRSSMVLLNLPAFHQTFTHLRALHKLYGCEWDTPLPTLGTFATRPPVQEMTVYLCFREGEDESIVDIAGFHGVDAFVAWEQVDFESAGDVTSQLDDCLNSESTDWPPIKLINPNGVTMEDFESGVVSWIKKFAPVHNYIMYCEVIVETLIDNDADWPQDQDECAHYSWCPPTFPPPSDDPVQPDWFLRVVNGGKLIVTLRFDKEEFERCATKEHSPREYESWESDFEGEFGGYDTGADFSESEAYFSETESFW